MQVIATAGHVDHGKSALVRALTGMEPDRWAEERRRGLTIDLGFAWMTLPGGEGVAFVDVPGHERFVPNMLAGVARCPPCCWWWRPTAAGCLSPPSTWLPSTRSASGTACSRSPGATWPIPARRRGRRSTSLSYQPGRGRGGRGQRGHRRRTAGTAGRAGAAGIGAARPRPPRAGPALGGPVVQHPGQRHRRHRYAARRDDDRGPGTAAHPVPAARQDQGPGITERAGHVGHRRITRGG